MSVEGCGTSTATTAAAAATATTIECDIFLLHILYPLVSDCWCLSSTIDSVLTQVVCHDRVLSAVILMRLIMF